MPYIVMKRDDIPAGILQVLDLDPNVSQQNLIYDPPGQTKYLSPIQNDLVALSGAGTIRTHGVAHGLAAWFVTNIDDGGGTALTATEANTNAQDVLDLLAYGDLTTAASALTLAAINGALTTGSISSGQLSEVLEILAGRSYTVPAGVQVQTGGAFAVSPAVGAEGGPQWGDYRETFDTSALLLSVNTGQLAGFLDPSFTYKGVGGAQGSAVVVLADDGSLY